MHKVEVTKEDFAALLKQFTGASGWRRSNGKGSFNLNQDQDEDKRRKLKYGDIVFIEKVDTGQ
ncbi:hypothetical protein P1A145kb_p090 [Pectobacterium phage DU_PP_I]|nr:hypothetical protein P1A145kb_p090 [Pectobacterium phage DU_PP_I]ATS93807.1 hypothetical protein P12B145kb_p091 [Pectobacterium phage DU_PP_IV]